MSLGFRKLVVVAAVATVFVLANAFILLNWLAEHGVIDLARHVRSEYLTGTSLAVMIALLILLTPSRRVVDGVTGWLKRCPVCDRVLLRHGRYCPDCGSKAN